MISLNQTQKLQQRLSPQQIQYLKFLQLPIVSLEQLVKQEIELNPMIEEIENEIEVIDEEIQDIKDDPDGDLNESEIEEAVEVRLREIEDNPIRWLDDMSHDYIDFVDRDELIRDLLDESDYGVINSYNSEYDTVSVNDLTFVVMRID